MAQGELAPVDLSFLPELLTGPVHIHVSLGLRDFTRADAQRITDAVLAASTRRHGPSDRGQPDIRGRMTDLIDLAGKSVIVTGASSGIGASTARLLHAAGAHPVLAARRVGRLTALSEELDGALAVPTDVTDPAQVRDLVAAAVDRHQRIDGLVNNAGASLHGPLDQVDLAEFDQILRLNVAGLLTVTQAVLPAMREQGFGRIVNISSGTTRRAAVGVGAYASTRSAVNMLSVVLRQELAGDGIAVSLLLPSITATEFGNGMFTLGASPRPGMVAHSPHYVAGVVLQLLRTGEESFDIPHGPEQPGLARVPA